MGPRWRLTSTMYASIWAPRDMSSYTLGLLRRMDKILFISSGGSPNPLG